MSGEPIKPRGRGAVSPQAGGAVPQAGTSTSDDIAAFVAKARALSPHAPGAKGRLIFALDATMSRQPTWDMACALQADMFRETAALGSLDIRLVYYRGFNECRATGWISDSARLATLMSKIDCRGGDTQIGKVLSEARREAVRNRGCGRIGRRRGGDGGRCQQRFLGLGLAAGHTGTIGKEGDADDRADDDADEQHRGPVQRKKQLVHGYPGPHPLQATPNLVRSG